MTSKQNKPNLLVCAIDNNMVLALTVWAYSFSRTAIRPIRVVIGYFSGELAPESREFVSTTLDYLAINHDFIELPSDSRFISQGYISSTTYARFMLADLIKESHVWIDVDTIARVGWDTLFKLVQNSPPESLLVVADRASRDLQKSDSSVLTFNAGVLGWPSRRRIAWGNRMDSLRAPDTDQDVLNELYGKQCFKVSEDYNFLSRKLDAIRGAEAPYIIHYAGAEKPWHLPRKFAKLCIAHQCSWSLWFESENMLIEELKGSEVLETFRRAQSRQQELSRTQDLRQYPGLRLISALQVLGIAGWGVLLILKLTRKALPRAVHPVH